MKSLALIPALLLAATPAFAKDTRLETRAYASDQVVLLEGRAGVQATIAFADDEHIENVAVGDSASWQITPNKRANLLFVKPLAPRARTNLTVVTDRHSYFFDLVSSPANRAVYLLRFTYPDEKPRQAAATNTAPLSDEEQRLASGEPLEMPIDPASLNFSWRRKGKEALLPSRVFDDGNSVYLSWSAEQSIPAILIRDARGNEGPVDYAVRGDVIVLGQVPSLLIFRSGREMASLEYGGTPKVSPGAAALAAALAGTTQSGNGDK